LTRPENPTLKIFYTSVSSRPSTLNSQTLGFVQLDLFLDSRSVVLANDVTHALLARDAARATVVLERLRLEEPGHHLLGALDGLCRTLKAWPPLSTSAADVERAIHWLETDVHPMAQAALGENAGNFMLAFWCDLAKAPGAKVYGAGSPQAYRAALYLRCGDPEAAAAAAQAVEQPDGNADALHWLAVARYRMEELDACRMPLMRLALLAPQRFPVTLQEIDDPLLNRDWYAFQAACHWLDPEGEEFGSWFPAWYLVEHPGIVVDFGSPLTLPETVPVQAMKAIARLVKLEKGGYSPALISARSRLRELDSNMFEFYMARRNVSHR
jgi:hypothetical protein